MGGAKRSGRWALSEARAFQSFSKNPMKVQFQSASEAVQKPIFYFLPLVKPNGI